MEESEDNMSAEEVRAIAESSPLKAKMKPKKRSLVERELETNLSARVTSPITNGDGSSTSRYGRTLRLKKDTDLSDTEKLAKTVKSPTFEKTPTKVQSPVYKMHASNSPVKPESPKSTPKRIISLDTNLDNQIENIYHENMTLSRFGSEEKKSVSPINKIPKVYVRKDLIQKREKEETVTLIKHMFSPVKSACKPNSHLSNILERSSEKYGLNTNTKSQYGYSSVVKTLDFDANKKKKKENRDVKNVISKSELFDMEAKCEYQVGDLAWARMGTYPFWPCIVTRDPLSGMFVKKKLFGRIERDVLHVTFFGDNGRRSWIVDSMLRKFYGQLEFEATREQFSPSAKKKDPRFYSAFFVSEKKLPQWNKSVEEAETLLREPKRLRIDILNDMIMRERAAKCTSKNHRSGKITRTDSDVSLSESLYDTLFSEDDGKTEDSDRSRNKSRNKSLDVSEVVTACLDNMAAKTGITKIQRQSHMDRWLQKAKSKTPEKSQGKVHLTQKEKDSKMPIPNSVKISPISNKKKKRPLPKTITIQKPYSFRKSERNFLPHNEHNNTTNLSQENNNTFSLDPCIEHRKHDDNDEFVKNIEESTAKVQNVCDDTEDNDKDKDIEMTEKNDLTNTSNENSIINNINESNNTFNDSMVSIDDMDVDKSNLDVSEANTSILDNTKASVSDSQGNSGIILQLENESQESFDHSEEEQDQPSLFYLENEEDEENVDVIPIVRSNQEKYSESCIPNIEQSNVDSISNSRKNSQAVISDSNKTGYSEVTEEKELGHQKSIPVFGKDSVNTDDLCESIVNNQNEDEILNENKLICETKFSDIKSSDALSYNGEASKTPIDIETNSKIINKCSIKSNLDSCLPQSTQNGYIEIVNTQVNEAEKVSKFGLHLQSHCMDDVNAPNSLITNTDTQEKLTKHLDIKEPDKEIEQFNSSTINLTDVDVNIESIAEDNNVETKSRKLELKSDMQMSIDGYTGETNNIKNVDESLKRLYNLNSITNPDEMKPSDNDFDLKYTEKVDKVFPTMNKLDVNISDVDVNTESVVEDNNVKNKPKELELKSDAKMSIDECTLETNNIQNLGERLKNECYNLNSITNYGLIKTSDNDFDLKDTGKVVDKVFLTMNKLDVNINDKQDDAVNNHVDIGEVSAAHLISNNISNNNSEKATTECNYDSNVKSQDQLCSTNTKLGIVEENNLIDDATTIKESNIITTKEDLLNTSKELISELVKVNGFYESTFAEDLEAETSSINSEDSEPLSVTRRKLKKTNETANKLENPVFVKYLEMRLDDLIDQHPDQSRDEIVEYLYKSWEYEQSSKSDVRKTDEIEQSNMVKGLGSQDPIKKRSINDKKHEKGGNKIRIKENSKNKHRLSLKRWLCPKASESNVNVNEIERNLETTEKVDDNVEAVDFTKSPNMEMTNKLSDTENFEIEPLTKISSRLDETMVDINKDIKLEKQFNDDNEIETVSICSLDSEELKQLPSKTSTQDLSKENDKIDEMKVKKELDPETVSINSEDSDVSVSKRKQRLKGGEKAIVSIEDPEFVKYLELRQDVLIDENPQLSQDEIVAYLYKTWLYEESGKSQIKKDDEINQSNLVKGLKHDIPPPKKIRKKVKVESDFVDDDEVMKDKPKRKTCQPYYNEDFSDIEDEIEIFEIKAKPKLVIPKLEITKAQVRIETNEEDNDVVDLDDDDVVDVVELYFEELTKPKPNLFKGLLRENVCEICEKTDNLVKCKGCHAMYHVDCVKKKVEVAEIKNIDVSSRSRKKKKKPGRKSKNLEDSGSHSDEKSQDLSDEHNMSIEDMADAKSRIVDADSFEAQLTEKMKEMIDSNTLEYDSCSSDDVIDWNNCVAGKCEIVDVKLKPKKENFDCSDFKCDNCQKFDIPVCFVCKMATSKSGVEYRQKCQVAHCYKHYHIECLDHWPQTQFSSGEIAKKKNVQIESLMCPRHVCHTCVSDDPRGCKTRFSGDKLARCVKCPATYHSFTKCLPAGSQILTGSLIICPRHYEHRPGKVPCHVNTGWCFICALGGTLICCEYCPTSFHAECLNIKPPEGGYMCEDCETGRLPLYGEMVWVKLGHYRWWPGLILHPSEIPKNIMAVKHSLGEFVVRFFGQYDHYWVNRGRVFPFQEGDSGKISSQKSKIDADFTTAMEHAQRACGILKAAIPNEEESLDIASSLLPPHYVKLKVNKPCGSLCGRRIDIEESSLTQCDCNPDEEDPCGPYSQCLNRMLLTECGPICRAGDRCNNRAFEKRLYPKLVPYRTPHRGWGLKTLEDIKAGQFVIEYVGELIDEDEFRRRMNRMHEIRDENFYFLTLDKERMIDAGPKGNLARFMNHCCEPNCETQKWTVLGDVRVGLFAINDIPANSEVTFNYNLECAGIDKKRCLCGAKRCSGYIGAKPKQDDAQQKKSKMPAKRTYKKRKPEESPSTKTKPKRPVGRPAKPRELTDIEKDLLIIKNATNGLSSDSDCSRLSSLEGDRMQKALKRKRVSFSTEEVIFNGKNSPVIKKAKLEQDKSSELG